MKPFHEHGGITIYHGDCLDVMESLTAVDHIITDPPYSEHTHAKQWIAKALTQDGAPRVNTAHAELGFDPLTAELRREVCREAYRLAKRWTLAFCDLESIWHWSEDFRGASLDYVRACIWDKSDSAPQFTGDRPASSAEAIVCAHRTGKKVWNGGGSRNVFRHATNGGTGAKPHPSTKPEPLMCGLIALFTDPNDLILDPFAGSGTTGVAAKRLGRNCILIEQQEKYCEIAAERMAQGSLFASAVTA